jgi:hypothetical protein
MTVSDLFDRFYNENLCGADIDKCLLVLIGNMLSGKPIYTLNVNDVNKLSRMIPDASKSFKFMDGGILYWCAFYNHTDKFPVGRLYHVCEQNMFEFYRYENDLVNQGFNLELMRHEQFANLVDEDTSLKRLYLYKQNNKKENAYYENLVNGRIESTTVEKGFYIKTSECLICKEKIDKTLTSTLADKNGGFMMGYSLCKKHYEEALQSESFISFLSKIFKQDDWFKHSKVSNDFILFDAIQLLDCELDCKIIKVKKNTITARRRRSGFEVILRLDSNTNYGYMINDNEGKELVRFDSANHHNVPYGPDHLHSDLSTKKVKSSFLTGYPQIDFKSILKELTKYE